MASWTATPAAKTTAEVMTVDSMTIGTAAHSQVQQTRRQPRGGRVGRGVLRHGGARPLSSEETIKELGGAGNKQTCAKAGGGTAAAAPGWRPNCSGYCRVQTGARSLGDATRRRLIYRRGATKLTALSAAASVQRYRHCVHRPPPRTSRAQFHDRGRAGATPRAMDDRRRWPVAKPRQHHSAQGKATVPREKRQLSFQRSSLFLQTRKEPQERDINTPRREATRATPYAVPAFRLPRPAAASDSDKPTQSGITSRSVITGGPPRRRRLGAAAAPASAAMPGTNELQPAAAAPAGR